MKIILRYILELGHETVYYERFIKLPYPPTDTLVIKDSINKISFYTEEVIFDINEKKYIAVSTYMLTEVSDYQKYICEIQAQGFYHVKQ